MGLKPVAIDFSFKQPDPQVINHFSCSTLMSMNFTLLNTEITKFNGNTGLPEPLINVKMLKIVVVVFLCVFFFFFYLRAVYIYTSQSF